MLYLILAYCKGAVLYGRMSRADPQINIRLPQDLKDQIGAEARKSGRTFSAEIVHRLRSSLTRDRVLEDEKKAIYEIREMVEALYSAVKTPAPPKKLSFGRKKPPV